jgi:glutamine synthetase
VGAVLAQACANPYLTAAAAAIAAAPGDAGSEHAPPETYEEAIDRLAGAAWAVDWLGEMFAHDTVELARREERLRLEATGGQEAATGWDVERYGEVG